MTPIPTQRTAKIPDRSIEELDVAICCLARELDAETYRFLMLVRDFDDRYGFAKWSLRSCAEWLAWRCGMTLSTAREKLRTAHALRELPVISAAFADGRLSYSKVRAVTRAADAGNEDLLLAYALDATAEQVEERCRQMRNVAPESTDVARRAWERRSLTVSRNPRTRHALDPRRATSRGRRSRRARARRTPSRPAMSPPASNSRPIASSPATDGQRSRPMRSWRSPRRIWGAGEPGITRAPSRITTKSSSISMPQPSTEGPAAPTCRSKRSSASPATGA